MTEGATTAGGVTVAGTWLGPPGDELLGVWTLPAGGTARGAVVLCPPLGKEAVHAYRTQALAAQQLAAAGVAALRVDYRGTGDSTGDELEPDAVARWQADVVVAVEHARAVAGAGGVALAGLRAGALLAGTAAAACGPLTGLALWDPVATGRYFLREQGVLHRLKVGADDELDDAGVPLVGAVLHPDAAAALKRLSLAAAAPAEGTPVLVAARPERADDAVLTALVERTGADRAEVVGHEQVFDVATFEIVLPAATTAAVSGWLAARFPAAAHPVALAPRDTVVLDRAGVPVRERLARLGRHELLAVISEPAAGPGNGAEPPLVVTLPSSTEHRVGTGRIWVDLARRLAAGGARVVRFDRRGTGDSGPIDPAERTAAYGPTAHEDLDDVLDALAVPAGRTALVGHCSGAWLAGEAAAEGRATSVVLLGAARFSVGRQTEDLVLVDDPDRAEQALQTRAGRSRAAVKPLIPGPLWRWLGRRDHTTAPELVLGRLRAAGVATTIVLAPVDHAHFVANRGARAVARLARRGWVADVHAGETGDHALVHRGMRTRSLQRAAAAVHRDLALPGATAPVTQAEPAEPGERVSPRG